MLRLKSVIAALSILLAVGISIAAGAPATQPATQPSAKELDIRRLLRVSGAAKLGEQVMGQMLGQFRQELPQVPADFWDQLKDEMNAGQLVELIVPIYDKHFSDEDIKAMITFYESPVGQKLVGELPQIAAESMTVGQAWGRDIGRRVTERLKGKGYLKT